MFDEFSEKSQQFTEIFTNWLKKWRIRGRTFF